VTARLLEIGKDWQQRVRKIFDAPLDESATPLDIAQAVLDDVERHVQPVGRGRRAFPYTHLAVRVRQATPDPVPLETAFDGFGHRVQERLRELRCEMPKTIAVEVSCLEEPPAGWPSDRLFAVEYSKTSIEAAADTSIVSAPALQITVLKGSAAAESYNLGETVISIGRSPEAIDEAGRVRRNDIAFLDTLDGVTETVGRAHAQLRFDPATGIYRLFDQGSSNGTSIIRNGTTIAVPPHDPRGVGVRSGDEIRLGRAAIRVVIER
jgi:pSer/pThr/pTyr-binding forkhead associated (FHA) protein